VARVGRRGARVTDRRAPAGMIALAERTHVEVARLARDPRAVVLLPLGAIEQHGPHLPLLVDWLGAEELARRIALPLRRAGWRPILAPSLPYGASPLAEAWGGTVSLPGPLLARLIAAVVGGLARHGFRRFVLVNYQADPGHLRAMAAATRALRRRRLRVVHAGFSPEPAANAAMLDPRVVALLRSPRPEREWHAGELETALLLALRPALVKRALARRLPPAWVDFRDRLRRGARTFRAIDPGTRGYFGWPAAARAETAVRALRLRAKLIGTWVVAGVGPLPPSRALGRRRERPATRGARVR